MRNREQPRAVFLVGFMGAGKSSVGQLLAAALGWRFLDLDQQIEARHQRSIAQIFAESGEAVFRRLETESLREALAVLQQQGPAVIALGGGAPVQPENAELLALTGEPRVFLDASFEVLRRRCQAAGSRPLFQDNARARQLYEARRPQYLRSGVRIDTNSKSIEQVAAEIEQALGLKRHTGRTK